MGFKISLFLLSLIIFLVFTVFSYTVAKEMWQQIDFDTTVKLQDHISRKYDEIFSWFSILGSVEVTFGIAGLFSIFSLFRLKVWSFLGWLIIIPATIIEVIGKLLLFHPATPVLFHRNVLETDLPSFYVHTNFSYPSGHMTRTVFLLTVFLTILVFKWKDRFSKLILISGLIIFGFMMALTRVYLGEHWLSDVIGGGFLGVSSGLFAAIFIIGKKYVKIR